MMIGITTEKTRMEKQAVKINELAIRSINVDGIDEKNRTVTFTFMTETPCHNWMIPEVCKCRAENADITRFKNGVMPMLYNHNRDIVLGKVDNIQFADGKAIATATFDTDDESEKIYQKVLGGSLKGVSVGYLRKSVVRVEKGMMYDGQTFDETTDVTELWEPFEVSIVSCPADPDCGVGRDINDKEITVRCLEKEREMDGQDKKPIDLEAERTKAIEAERKRTADIMDVCRVHGIEAKKCREFIDGGKSIDEVRADVLDLLAKKEEPIVNVNGSEHENFHKKAVEGLAVRYGVADKDAKANEYKNIRNVMMDCVIDDGLSEREASRMDNTELWEELNHRAMGSEQFASIIDDFAHKAVMKGYNEQPFIFGNFVSRGSVADFKTVHRYRLGLSDEPVEMPPESDEFTYTNVSDESVAVGIKTYGKAIKFTREIFINDDMGTVVKAIQAQSAGFRRFQEKEFFRVLTGTKDLFSKAHGNLVQTNKDISAAAYNEMRRLARKQKDFEGKAFVGATPTMLIASDEYTADHLELLRSTANPTAPNSGSYNTAQNMYTLFTTPYLDGKAYYVVCPPSVMEGIEYTTLNGNDTPSSRVVNMTRNLGVEYQYWMDFAFNLIDYRAFVKNEANA